MSIAEQPYPFDEPTGERYAVQEFDEARQDFFQRTISYWNFPRQSRHDHMVSGANVLTKAHAALVRDIITTTPIDIDRTMRALAGLIVTEDSIRYHFFASISGDGVVDDAMSLDEHVENLLGMAEDFSSNKDMEPVEILQTIGTGVHHSFTETYQDSLNLISGLRRFSGLGRVLAIGDSLQDSLPGLAKEAGKIAIGTAIGVVVGSRLRQ